MSGNDNRKRDHDGDGNSEQPKKCPKMSEETDLENYLKSLGVMDWPLQMSFLLSVDRYVEEGNIFIKIRDCDGLQKELDHKRVYPSTVNLGKFLIEVKRWVESKEMSPAVVSVIRDHISGKDSSLQDDGAGEEFTEHFIGKRTENPESPRTYRAFTEDFLADIINSVAFPEMREVPDLTEATTPTTPNAPTEKNLKEFFESLRVGDLASQNDVMHNSQSETPNGVLITSYLKRQLDYVSESLKEGGTHIRYLQGVSGLGKSISLQACVKYLREANIFTMYFSDPGNLVAEDFDRSFVEALYECNSKEVWDKYLPGLSVSYDEIGDSIVEDYRKTRKDIMRKLINGKNMVAVVLDDFQNLIGQLKRDNKIPHNHDLVKLVTSKTPLKNGPFIVLVAASQHHGYKDTLSSNDQHYIEAAPIPLEPMDILGMYQYLRRVASMSRMAEKNLKVLEDHIRFALVHCGAVNRLATEAIRGAYGKDTPVPLLEKEGNIMATIRKRLTNKIRKHIAERTPAKDLVTQFIDAWRQDTEGAINSASFEKFLDLGIMVPLPGVQYEYRYVSVVAELIHIQELCDITADTCIIGERNCRDFEPHIIAMLFRLGLPMKMCRLARDGISVSPNPVPKMNGTYKLGHVQGKGAEYRLEMQGRPLTRLRSKIRENRALCVGFIPERPNFPALDFFILRRENVSQPMELYGIQISFERNMKQNRFDRADEALLKLLNLINGTEDLRPTGEEVGLPLTATEKVTDEARQEVARGGINLAMNRVKVPSVELHLGSTCRSTQAGIKLEKSVNQDHLKVTMFKVYIGRAEPNSQVDTNDFNTIFMTGYDALEANFKVFVSDKVKTETDQ